MGISKCSFYRPSCVLRANGPDTREFLQGQFSNDLSKASARDTVFGLWLNRKGKIVADSFALCRSVEEFLLVSIYCSESTIFERLDEYLVMDDVEFAALSSGSFGISLWGDACCEVLAKLGLELPPEGGWIEKECVFVFWGNRSLEKSIEIIFHGAVAEGAFIEVKDFLKKSTCVELGELDLARLATQDCRPRVGIEIGIDDLPQEVGLVNSAVSFKKGCYLGQEVMARIHAMGKIRRELLRVKLGRFVNPEKLPLEIQDMEGKKKGVLRSLVEFEGSWLGLAIVSTGSVFPLRIEIGDTYVSVALFG